MSADDDSNSNLNLTYQLVLRPRSWHVLVLAALSQEKPAPETAISEDIKTNGQIRVRIIICTLGILFIITKNVNKRLYGLCLWGSESLIKIF